MTDASMQDPLAAPVRSARDWVQVLARYREPNHLRSGVELAITLGPFLLLWVAAWWALSVSYLLAFGIALVNAGFLVRLFAIQHDCGHASFFRNRQVSDWVGRFLGVLTLTPYDVWRRTHSVHHSTAGNLDQRGMGDIHTLTVTEYYQLSWFQRMVYKLYRNPLVLFGLGPSYIFFVQNRIPLGLMTAGKRYWTSAMGTNLSIAAALAVMIYFGGLGPVLLIFVPTSVMAATLGIWMFYVQHQFEETQWRSEKDWALHDAALHGSSHYDLPGLLRWMTANLGVHHVHHLYSRIPFYRLPEVLRDHPALADAQRMTLLESFRCIRLHLWDDKDGKLLSFSAARAKYGAA